MLKKINEAVSRFGLLKNAKDIIVALSGGADSMALLHALLELKDELGLDNVYAAHFNHGIRGDEAMRDQNFVAEQCKKLGVKLFLGNADVPRYAKENNLSLELAARKLRYQFFETLDNGLIATAHTASDNTETVLFNLARGTALSGLCGIPPKRDKYIRPLILCTRDDVENYCAQKGIEFVTDSTNLSDDYTRNNIRHNVVPVLKKVNQSVESAVSRMTITLREDEDFINRTVQKEFDLICRDGLVFIKGFDTMHPAIAKRIIVRYCEIKNIDIDNFHINGIYDICRAGIGKISLSQKKYAIVSNGILKIESAQNQPDVTKFNVEIKRSKNELFKNNQKVHNLLLKNTIDCDRIVGRLVLRERMTGDVIRLKNKNCTKTLKKLYNEYKIPLNERDVWPVLADEEGIVWIHKIGVADRVAVDEMSNNIYTISVEKIKGI